jgi:hypothetical protein
LTCACSNHSAKRKKPGVNADFGHLNGDTSMIVSGARKRHYSVDIGTAGLKTATQTRLRLGYL